MKLNIVDHDGPTGPYVGTGDAILSLDALAGQIALLGGAIQSGIGNPDEGAALQAEIDAAIARATRG